MNVHPNAPTLSQIPAYFRRPTHKQSIAMQTATDPGRFFGQWWRGASRNAKVMQTTLK
jgi:hypothetical protein